MCAVGLKTLQLGLTIKSLPGRLIAQSHSLIENIQMSQRRLSILDIRPVSQSSLMNVIKRVRIADVEQTRIFAAHQSMFGRAARQTDEGLAAHRSRSSVLTLIDEIAPNPHIRLVAGVGVHRNAKVGGRSDQDLGCCFEVALRR